MFRLKQNTNLNDIVLNPQNYEGKNLVNSCLHDNNIDLNQSKQGIQNFMHRRVLIDLTAEFPNPLFFEAGESFVDMTHIVLQQNKDELKNLVRGYSVYDKSIDKIIDANLVTEKSDILIGGEAIRYLLEKSKEKTFLKVAEEYLTNRLSKEEEEVFWDSDDLVMRTTQDFQGTYAKEFREKMIDNPNKPVMSLVRAKEDTYDAFLIDKLETLPPSLRMSIEDRRSPIDIMYDELIRAINVFSRDIKTLENLNIYLASYRAVYNKLYDIICKSHIELNKSSIKEIISKKEGFIRRLMLSTVTDNSMRSVITSGGLSSELDKVFIPEDAYKKLEESLRAQGYDGDIYVTYNRAPTLHLHSILSLKAQPDETHSIKHHPVLNPGFNADHDGDTMSVIAPSLIDTIKEISVLMNPTFNPYKAGTGEIILEPQQDNIYGMYILTDYDGLIIPPISKTKSKYNNIESLLDDFKDLSAHVSDTVSLNGEQMTVGYHIFKYILGDNIFYKVLELTNNKYVQHTKKSIEMIFTLIYNLENKNEIYNILNKFSKYTYITATLYPPTLDVNTDLDIPDITDSIEEKYKLIYEKYEMGLINKSTYNSKISSLYNEVSKPVVNDILPKIKGGFKHMAKSGAKGSNSNLEQIFILKGLISTEDGDNFIIKKSFLQGLSSMEHAIVGIATRMSLVSKSQKPADTGYLQRQFVHTTQDLIIRSEDCGTNDGIIITKHDIKRYNELKNKSSEQDLLDSARNYILGRVTIDGNIITEELATKLSEDIILNNKELKIRSVLTCKDPCCAKCYGIEWSTRKFPLIGRHIGIIASQSISELATQISMKDFQKGGIAGSSSIGSDFDMVKSIANCKTITPEMFITHRGKICPDYVAEESGYIVSVEHEDGIIVCIIPYKWVSSYEEFENNLPIYKNLLKSKEIGSKIYGVFPIDHSFLKKEVIKGEGIMKTQGLMSIKDIVKYGGLLKAQQYIAYSISTIYSTSSNLKPVHVEVLALGMTRYVGIKDYNLCEQISSASIKRVNEDPSAWVGKIVSTLKAPSCTSNWLASMSFDRMTNHIISAILYQLEDDNTSLYSRVVTGQPPILGSYYNKNYLNDAIKRWKESSVI